MDPVVGPPRLVSRTSMLHIHFRLSATTVFDLVFGLYDSAFGLHSHIHSLAMLFPEETTHALRPDGGIDVYDDDDTASQAGTTVSLCGSRFDPPIVITRSCSTTTCKLCLSSCTAQSPITPANEESQYIPWGTYKKGKDKSTRSPTGRLCAICRNTFYALGWDCEFKSPDEYHKTIGTPTGKEKHQKFLGGRTEWIKQHMLDGGRTKLKSKATLREATTEIKTYSKESTKLLKPKRAFIVLEEWDDKIDGVLDTSKIVDEDVFGVQKKGIWKNVGRKGVYEEEAAAERGAVEETTEADNIGAFGEERLQAKRLQLRGIMDAGEKARSSKAVDAIQSTAALDVLAFLQGSGAKLASAQDQDKEEHHEDDGDEAGSGGSSSGQDIEPDEAAVTLHDRWRRTFGAAAAVKSQPARSTTSTATSSTRTPTSAAVLPQATRKRAHGADAARTPSAAFVGHDSIHVDGRHKRLIESITTIVEGDIATGIQEIQEAFNDESADGLFQFSSTASGKVG
jgi:hypothetical protein